MSFYSSAAVRYTPTLFADLTALVIEAFNVLHDIQWRAPWDAR